MDPSKSQNNPAGGWNTSEKSQPVAPPPYHDQAGYPNPGYAPAGGYPDPSGYQQYGQPAGPYPGQPAGPYPGQPAGPYPGQPAGPYPGQTVGPYPGQPITVQPTVYVASSPLTNPLPDYLGYSIFTMLCCCLPLGIAALVYSISTRNANMAGHQQIAENSSKMARTLNHVALGIGITAISLYIIAVIVVTVTH